MSHMASSSTGKADIAFPNTTTAVPVLTDNSIRGVEDGVSPAINAFRSPYPPSPTYFVTVVPPDDFLSSELSQVEHDRHQRGSLLPLYPSLGGQLWAISREFALPSLGGLMLYLADDGQGNRGPRIGDGAWQALWSRYFNEDDVPSTSVPKTTAFAPSRRSSTTAGDSFADPSSSAHSHAADLSRSTLGETSSSRPSIPYVSSRPSPRVEALPFPRRDTSAEWSPSVRSAHWVGNTSSSSASRAAPSVAPFAHIPILARLEWQVDVNKAPWWPAWIASRGAARERPQHKVRKSMHLASDPPKRETDKQVADDDGEEDEEVAHRQQASTRDAEPQVPQQTTNHNTDFAEAGPSAPRSVTPTKVRDSLVQSLAPSATSALLPPSIAEDENSDASEVRSPSSPPQSQYSDEDAQDEVVRHNDPVEEKETDLQDELISGRCSPSDEPLRSARASILSMSSDGSQRTPSPSVTSAQSSPKDVDAVVAPTTPLASDPRSASPKPHLEEGSAPLSHHGSSEQSRTGYSELLEANGADDQQTDRDGDYSLEELPPQHAAAYLALPDSPSSENSAPIDDHAASNHEQQPFSQEGLQLRHSFILDAGDEGMWRDLQLQDVDQLFPEPREQTRAIPSASRHSKDLNLVHEAQLQEPSENFERLHRSSHADAAARQSQDEQHHWTFDAPAQAQQGLHSFQSFVHANDFARDAYYSPQRSNAARIQSWIGKTPTGRPSSEAAFDVEPGLSVDEDGLLLPNDSDIDEVVGLWTSKILQDPHSVPYISAPAPTADDAEQAAADEILTQDEQTEAMPEPVVVQHESENKRLGTAPAPTVSLLSPIHLDAAAFDGVKPALGSLTVPQLLSPTAVGDAFDTPRPPSTQRSASTPLVQQHPPSSPSSLAPPQDRRPSCASRRSSGDLSDTLEDMEKALQLLSPSVSPNPGLGLSPDPSGRKMSSRDSLAYARSISASVTPSPKWIARAKAATAKSRNARSSFAVRGSPFERGHVSPRPASTSAVSSSRSRSPGFQAPISASRLMEFAQEESIQRKAKTEVGDADSVRMEDSQDEDVSKAVPATIEAPAAPVQVVPDVLPSSASARSIAGEEEQPETVDTTSKDQELDEHQSVDEEAVNKECVNEKAAEAGAMRDETAEQGGASRDSTSFTSAEQEDDIASIQRFLHGRVAPSLDSGTSASLDRSEANGLEQESSADGTIIERSASLESGLQSLTSEPRFFDAHATVTAVPQTTGTSDPRAHLPSTKEETISNERWSQNSFATGNFSSHPSGDSLHSSGPRRGLQAHTPIFTYDAHLSSEPTTVDTQLSSASADSDGLSVAGQLVKSYMSTSPSDDAFFRSPGPMGRPLAGTHDDTLDEDEIRTMNEDTRAAVREALSESTAHHINILPAVVPTSSSNKSSISPTASPLSSHSSLGDHLRRRGSASSLNHTSMSGGAGSNASSPNLNSGGSKSPRRKPSRLNLNIDGLARSPPSSAATAAARMSSTSPRTRFAQLPPSPSLHPSYKAAMSSPLSQSFPVMADTGSPQGKTFLPSLTSFTSLKGGLAG